MMSDSRLFRTRQVFLQTRNLMDRIDSTLLTLTQTPGEDERFLGLRSLRKELDEIMDRMSPRPS